VNKLFSLLFFFLIEMTMNYFTNLSDDELLLKYSSNKKKRMKKKTRIKLFIVVLNLVDKRQFDRVNPMNRAPFNVGSPSSAQCLIIGKWYYENGRLFQYNKPLDWLFKADRLGEKEAAHFIGRIYFDTGSDSQCEYAYQWFKKSALANNAESEYYLGEMYSKGKGVDKDVGTALAWYTKAAQRGHLQAQVEVGLTYAATPNHRESLIKAHYWLSKAAEKNNLDAIRTLSKLKKNANYHLLDLVRSENPYPQISKKVETPPEKPSTPIQSDKTGINVTPSLGQNADNAPQELVQTAIESLHVKDNVDNQPSPHIHNNSLKVESETIPTQQSNDAMNDTMDNTTDVAMDVAMDNTTNNTPDNTPDNTTDNTPDNTTHLESRNNKGKSKPNKVDWTSTKRKSLSEERALQYDFEEMKSKSENKSAMNVDAEPSRNTKSPMAMVDQNRNKGKSSFSFSFLRKDDRSFPSLQVQFKASVQHEY
jgi:TPR repeat protein